MRIVLIAMIWFFPSLAHEYLYPVGMSVKQERVYVAYQKTATHLELWEWDYITGYANQLLLSRYSPAGFTLLPDESGFSFIDNGLLKIKQFIKRSPRTIAFDAPIYQVELVHWMDPTTCYVAGRYNDYSGIFQIDWDGMVQPAIYQEGRDALYPQKIDDLLYYIERTEDDAQYRLVCTHYQIASHEEWNERITACQTHKRGETLIDFQSQPIAFLHMSSHDEGVAVGYPLAISRKDKAIPFKLYRLFIEGQKWNAKELFSFSIPTALLLSGTNQRLYESILPLLPKVCQNHIYFVDSSTTEFLTLHRFDLSTAEITQCAKGAQHYFGVCPFEGGNFYGGQMGGDIELLDGVQLMLGRYINKLT